MSILDRGFCNWPTVVQNAEIQYDVPRSTRQYTTLKCVSERFPFVGFSTPLPTQATVESECERVFAWIRFYSVSVSRFLIGQSGEFPDRTRRLRSALHSVACTQKGEPQRTSRPRDLFWFSICSPSVFRQRSCRTISSGIKSFVCRRSLIAVRRQRQYYHRFSYRSSNNSNGKLNNLFLQRWSHRERYKLHTLQPT